ncbi:SWIM zinc finger family protein [uncultured Thermanaerothrix sp.]|uniref:SWIM zinc finger family protein n=1 Tax=uncultured Thermanaerothrix sp. TaxID=1195149 RepID=UPI002617794F|nr:SWIM zinc finger family protein [uncultured Thermanaerothrix sp.]
MDYGMIGKREKARRYAQERERIRFQTFTVTVEGENNTHTVQYDHGKWQCDCEFFRSRGVCSHTMALEIVLENMLIQPVNS